MLQYKPIKVPQDLNSQPTGDDGAQPVGGIKGYQDDFDTNKPDPLTNELGDDLSARTAVPRHILAEELAKQDDRRIEGKMANDDLREHIEDLDEHDK